MGDLRCNLCGESIHYPWRFCPKCGSLTNINSNGLPFISSEITGNMFIMTTEGNIEYCNQAMLNLIACSSDEVKNMTIFSLIHPADTSVVQELMQKIRLLQQKEANAEVRFIIGNNVIWVNLNLIAIKDYSGKTSIMAWCVNISQLRAIQAKIENQNAIIRLLYDTSLFIINRLDVKELLLTILQQAANIVGTSHGYMYLYNPDTDTMEMEIAIGAYVNNRVTNLKRTGGGIGGVVWKSGQPIIVDDYSAWSESLPNLPFYPKAVIAVPLKCENEVISILTLVSLETEKVFGQDEVDKLLQFGQLASIALNNAMLFSELKKEIAERTIAEENLYKANQKLTAIMDSAKDFIYIKNKDSVLYEANPAMYETLGLSREELIGKTFQDVFGEDIAKSALESDKLVLQGQIVDEEVVLHINNQEYVFDKLETPLRDKQGNIIGISGIMRDVTERKRAESKMLEAKEMLARSEKLASIGVMAAGISHEINQPLNSIRMNATGFLYRYKKGMSITLDEAMDGMSEISTQVDRIDRIMKQMLSIIRNNDTELVPCNVNKAVEHALDLVSNQINKRGIIIRKKLSEEDPLVLATEVGLVEAIINVIINAIQALDRVKDRTKEITITSTVEKEVVLSICDNGPGISDEIKKKIFTPFFSTKNNQRNMGVGLSITQSIVHICKGDIKIYSDGIKGTRVVIRFPLVDSNSL